MRFSIRQSRKPVCIAEATLSFHRVARRPGPVSQAALIAMLVLMVNAKTGVRPRFPNAAV